MNLEVETIFESKKHIVKIKLAELEGEWTYGYSFMYDNYMGGGGVSPSFDKNRKKFKSRIEAREEALVQMLSVFKNPKYVEVKKTIMLKFESQGNLF